MIETLASVTGVLGSAGLALFPGAFALGVLQRRQGTEACIAAHLAHNLALPLLLPWVRPLA